VLDANVLVPDSLRSTLLRVVNEALYQACWSDEIVNEVARTLAKPRLHRKPESIERIVELLRSDFADCVVAYADETAVELRTDAKDRHVLACAITAEAQIIVTQNVAHFPDDALHPYGIVAQTPDAFLTQQFSIWPEVFVQIVSEQASALKTPPHC
jgi:putative PIN family toxin of toxin-antitoxin system